MGKAFKNLALGAAVAGAAGYLAGLLTAPKSGKDTRDELRETATTGVNEVEKQLKALHTELARLVDEAKVKSEDLSGQAHKDFATIVDKAKESKDKARGVLNAVHQGDASDKDLQKALTDAKKAIEHLKDYLDKDYLKK